MAAPAEVWRATQARARSSSAGSTSIFTATALCIARLRSSIFWCKFIPPTSPPAVRFTLAEVGPPGTVENATMQQLRNLRVRKTEDALLIDAGFAQMSLSLEKERGCVTWERDLHSDHPLVPHQRIANGIVTSFLGEDDKTQPWEMAWTDWVSAWLGHLEEGRDLYLFPKTRSPQHSLAALTASIEPPGPWSDIDGLLSQRIDDDTWQFTRRGSPRLRLRVQPNVNASLDSVPWNPANESLDGFLAGALTRLQSAPQPPKPQVLPGQLLTEYVERSPQRDPLPGVRSPNSTAQD